MPTALTHRVLMITTGGTIGGKVAHEESIGLSDEVDVSPVDMDGGAFSRTVDATRGILEDQLNREIHIDPVELDDIDSSDVDPSLWVKLIELICENYDKYDSFLVTHGTNTMGYTCAALSFSIANSGKPIVVTGSQVPFGLPGSDALTNLENALRVAVGQGNKRGQEIHGVVAVFGSHIITGTRVKKDTEFDYDAFRSFGDSAIGRIGRIIDINPDALTKHNWYLSTNAYPMAVRKSQLIVDTGFNTNIVSLTEFPGMRPEFFQTLVEEDGVRGFILRAYGAGDPAAVLRPAFKMLKEKEIPIVVTTQAPNGNSSFRVNEPGRWLLDNRMAIPAYDMSIESQTVKLAWLLFEGRRPRRYRYEEICDKMTNDMRGEVHVRWED